VRNVPVHLSHIEYNLSGFSLLKERLGIPQDDLLYIYLGGLFDFRGIEIMLKVFAKMDPRKHIVFMGYGEWQSIIETFAKANSNIHFHKAVKPDEVCIYASQADVGIHVPENICLSYYFSLPNKVFEYILSGLPIVVSDFPEMRRLINEGQCGWAIEPTEEALYSVIISISSSDILVRKQNVLQYRKELKWQNEEKVLIDAYHNLVK
jgi:glycosyltransferase involved in cell wall biosynthesis